MQLTVFLLKTVSIKISLDKLQIMVRDESYIKVQQKKNQGFLGLMIIKFY